RAAHRLQRAGDALAADSVFAIALERLYRRHSRRRRSEPDPGPSAMVEHVRGYLDEHAARSVSLAELARLASVSMPTLVRRYRAGVDVPLRLSPDQMRELGYRAVDEVVNHLATIRGIAAGRPPDRDELDRLVEPVPREADDPVDVLRHTVRDLAATTSHPDHP